MKMENKEFLKILKRTPSNFSCECKEILLKLNKYKNNIFKIQKIFNLIMINVAVLTGKEEFKLLKR